MGIKEVGGQGVKLLWHYLYLVSTGLGVHPCLLHKAFGKRHSPRHFGVFWNLKTRGTSEVTLDSPCFVWTPGIPEFIQLGSFVHQSFIYFINKNFYSIYFVPGTLPGAYK